jgi:hypothetical protein
MHHHSTTNLGLVDTLETLEDIKDALLDVVLAQTGRRRVRALREHKACLHACRRQRGARNSSRAEDETESRRHGFG